MTQDYVGEVCLDYTWYPGEDLYSDGEIEDRLLEIVKTTPEEDLNKVIAQEKDWAVLYHLSSVRENIVGALPITREDDVLEIGAGCGAITGALTAKAGSVTSIDLSKRRSLVNANRHKDASNLRIIVGNFQDIEPNLDKKYDYITLIGVFEYAVGYIGTDDPYREFLRQISRHLKPGGRVVIAIENRLGMKYWAGAREDHTGHYFEGLENYPDPVGVHTFSRPELEELFRDTGFTNWTFSYPYPDYKLPSVIYSDDRLPQRGELNNNIYNFDRDRLVLFDERKVYDSLLETGQYPLFSNSYLVVIDRADLEQKAEEDQVIYSKFSTERDPKYAIRTDILKKADGSRYVRKSASRPEGQAHIRAAAENGTKLEALYAGERFAVNRGVLNGNALDLEFVSGKGTWEEELVDLWKRGCKDEVLDQLHAFAERIRNLADKPFVATPQFEAMFGTETFASDERSLPVTDLDMVAENLMCMADGGKTLIDYEWTFDFPIPVRYVIWRIYHYFLARNAADEAEEEYLFTEGFSKEDQAQYLRMEAQWQKVTAGEIVPLRELFAEITPGTRTIGSIAGAGRSGQLHFRSSLYYSDGSAYTEESKINRNLTVEADGSFRFTIHPAELGRPKRLRWDPIEYDACRIRIEQILSNVSIFPEALDGFEADGWIEFWSGDPAFELCGQIDQAEEITLCGHLEMINAEERLPAMNRMRQERDLLVAQRDIYIAELENLKQANAAQQATRAFRSIEKVRSVRNFFKARAKGVRDNVKLVMYKKGMLKELEVDPRTLPYAHWYETHHATQRDLDGQRITTLTQMPKFSILVPTYQTPMNYLREMIDSVLAQTYTNWELCIADASVTTAEDGTVTRNEELRQCLDGYAQDDPRIRVVYLEQNLGISENTNAAAALASGDYIGLLDHDDLLAPDALYETAVAINNRGADVIYTDEDKVSMDGTVHFDPNMKPDFDIDLLRSHNYITHFFVVRTDLFMQTGGFRSEFDGAQDHDLIFRCTEIAENIVHVPKVLYHWRTHMNSTAMNPESKLYAYEAGRKSIEEHLKRQKIDATVERIKYWGLNHVTYATPENPLVSIVIPNKDHTDDLDKCIRSIMEHSAYRNLEIVVVENNSTEQETFTYYDKIHDEFPCVRVVRWESTFNYSAINNLGVREAKGDYLLLLNNDTELIKPESIGEMLGICMRSEVGCVGAKLLYADDTVQHGGIVLGFGGFGGHVFTGIKEDDMGFMMRAQITHECSAVTAACMMVRRDVYEEMGGFSEEFAVALNDVDFCMKIRAAGYKIVFTPFSLWHHYESKSRGYEDTPEKKSRFEQEVARFRSRWADTVDAGDPYYNPNFSVDRAPYTF